MATSYNSCSDDKNDKVKKSKEKMAKENHSEIERRRRNRMNYYIKELSNIIPNLLGQKKMDKLTILRTTVQYIRLLRNHSETTNNRIDQLNIYNEINNNENENKSTIDKTISFLTCREFKQALIEGGNGFMFIYSSDTNKILYVSDVVALILGHTKEKMEGQSIYDFIHVEDRYKLDTLFIVMSNEFIKKSTINNQSNINKKNEKLINDNDDIYNTNNQFSNSYLPKLDITLRFECDNSTNNSLNGLEYIYPPSLCSTIKSYCGRQRFKDNSNGDISSKEYLLVNCFISLTKFKYLGPEILLNTSSNHIKDGESLCIVAIGCVLPNVVSINHYFDDNNIDELNKNPNEKFIIQLDKNGNISYIQQPTTNDFFGNKLLSLDDLIGKSIFSIVYENDRDILINGFFKLLSTHKNNTTVTILLRLYIHGLVFKTFATFEIITNAFNNGVECVLMECDDLIEEDKSILEYCPTFTPHSQKRAVQPIDFSLNSNYINHSILNNNNNNTSQNHVVMPNFMSKNQPNFINSNNNNNIYSDIQLFECDNKVTFHSNPTLPNINNSLISNPSQQINLTGDLQLSNNSSTWQSDLNLLNTFNHTNNISQSNENISNLYENSNIILSEFTPYIEKFTSDHNFHHVSNPYLIKSDPNLASQNINSKFNSSTMTLPNHNNDQFAVLFSNNINSTINNNVNYYQSHVNTKNIHENVQNNNG